MRDETALAAAAARVREAAGAAPFDLAVILGSGLGGLAGRVGAVCRLCWSDLPGFPPPTVTGHAGRLIAGELEGWRILLFQGRYHLYEGYSAWEVGLPVRLAHRLGCRRLLLTNAAGGINPGFHPGDFMFIDDHLNLQGDNPLRGLREAPFVDLSRLYRQDLYDPLARSAARQGIPLHRGVLAALSGPSYETPAEIRMLRHLGADAVSMSTVPEAIMAAYLGMEVAGLSLIANPAAGLQPGPLAHDDVLATARLGEERLLLLAESLAANWRQRSKQS